MGVWSTSFSLMSRLPSECSILTAELFAIHSALCFLSAKLEPFTIFSDSLSAINSLQSIHKSSHFLVCKIAKLFFSNKSCESVLEWVPGHQELAGNEMAESLAKRAVQLPNNTSIRLSSKDIKNMLKKHYNEAWQRQ